MRYIILLSFFILFLFSSSINNKAKELYLEANCQKCHLQDEKFDPNSIKKKGLNSKVKEFKDLKKWIIDCDNYFNIGWFPKEQENVANYLNKVFYKLKK